MPTPRPDDAAAPPALGEHLEALRAAVLTLATQARTAGLDVPVPTCPDWTVRRLVGHLGAVHRRTTSLLRAASGGSGGSGGSTGSSGEQAGPAGLADLESEAWRKVAKTGRSSADPLDWLASGAITLVGALSRAADDLPAATLYDNGLPARAFWARRMCHETTIHAVDALAAALGRAPTPAEAAAALPLDTGLAVDGLDELLLELVPLGPLRSPEPLDVVVRAADADVVWSVRVRPDAAPTARRSAPSGDGPVVEVVADAATLHLGLWHRTPLAVPLWPLWHAPAVL